MYYAIPECNIEKLERKLATIARKCNKYGCAFSYEKVDEHLVEVTFKDADGDWHKAKVNHIGIEIEGKAIINGWEFVATIEHTENGNIIRKVATDAEVVDEYKTCAPKCDHCHIDRFRKDTYLVRNLESGEIKQVGKSCLKDYTGGLDAELAAAWESVFVLAEEYSESNYSGCTKYYDIFEWLKYFAECTIKFGFAPKSSERSTVGRAQDYYDVDHKQGGYYMKDWYAAVEKEMQTVNFNANSEEAVELATASLDWIRNSNDTSDYMWNLKITCSKDEIESKHFGFVASLPNAYKKHLGFVAKKEATTAKKAELVVSDFMGNVGEKFDDVVVLESIHSYETHYSYYGETNYIYTFRCGNNVIVWKSGYNSEIIENVGEQFSLSGKIKEHSEYNGTKQMVLTRCKYALVA